MNVLTSNLFSLFVIILTAFMGCHSIDAQEAKLQVSVDGPTITFQETDFNFGKIKSGEKVSHEFEFVNNGTEPLIIKDVKTTCGCTVSNFPKEPIMPGKKNVIEATFNSKGKSGKQNKVITITTNTAEGSTKVALVGVVEAEPALEQTAENNQ